jgi:hypothetical protein
MRASSTAIRQLKSIEDTKLSVLLTSSYPYVPSSRLHINSPNHMRPSVKQKVSYSENEKTQMDSPPSYDACTSNAYAPASIMVNTVKSRDTPTIVIAEVVAISPLLPQREHKRAVEVHPSKFDILRQQPTFRSSNLDTLQQHPSLQEVQELSSHRHLSRSKLVPSTCRNLALRTIALVMIALSFVVMSIGASAFTVASNADTENKHMTVYSRSPVGAAFARPVSKS